jgi:hypothetical protein
VLAIVALVRAMVSLISLWIANAWARRKQITDLDERIMTTKLLRELHISGWEIRKRPDEPSAGFTFKTPEGPEKS